MTKSVGVVFSLSGTNSLATRRIRDQNEIMNYGIIIEGLEATNKKLAAENERLRGELIASQNARKAMCSGWHRFVEMASVHKNRKASEAGANLDREQDAAMGVTSAAPAPAPDSRQAAILEALDDDPTAFHAVAPAPAPSPAPASPSVRGALEYLCAASERQCDYPDSPQVLKDLGVAAKRARKILSAEPPHTSTGIPDDLTTPSVRGKKNAK